MNGARAPVPPASDPAQEVAIPVGPHTLRGTLRWKGRTRGVVVFAHGSGSSRYNPRNRHVATLAAAARRPDRVAAVVSRGGRPDLAWDELPAVRAPTLLIVGGTDEPVLTWNRDCLDQLDCPKELAVVPAASHLFPEPGALDEVARLARDWFVRHMQAPTPAGV